MGSSYDVNANALIESVAKQLQGETHLKPPTWAAFAKTGAHKDRPPARQDWWYVRAASVLRTINRMGPIGVAKLRTKYGGKRNRGHQPDEPRLGSGNILRKILQQLEKAQYIAPVTKGIHKGRIIAPKGRSLLDKTAAGLRKAQPKPAAPKVAPVQPKPAGKPTESAHPETV